jgi:hypothetical protein
MKSLRIAVLIAASVFTYINAASQNAMINVLSQNAGVVKKGGTVFLEVTVTNTDPFYPIGAYRLRPQINIPAGIVNIADTGHVLPAGWTIIKNDGSAISVSNGTGILSPNSEYTILIALYGKKTGGPSTIIAQLSFSDGKAPGTAMGSLPGDDASDNSSTTTIKVF